MPDDPDPPRQHYGFKEREFKRDNAPAGGAAPSAKDLAKLAGGPGGKFAERPAAKTAPPAAGPAKADDPNDVHATLLRNREAERRHNLDAIEIRKVSSRRRREFWLILVGGNLSISLFVFVLGINPITVIFGLAGLIIFSLGLAWIMFQVMDRY